MWTVVYIAPNASLAEKLREKLAQEGLLVTLRAAGSASISESGSVEILVPESEAEEASEIINEYI
ncbi:MAG: DUF2007 domain-containing protein [Thermoanaerobacteraceae bacterium]|nr:DUF2007 domain-containing protein [Thermoanaerobacteraceae bacterium]